LIGQLDNVYVFLGDVFLQRHPLFTILKEIEIMDQILLIASKTLKKYGVYLFLVGIIIGAMVAQKQKMLTKKEKIEIR